MSFGILRIGILDEWVPADRSGIAVNVTLTTADLTEIATALAKLQVHGERMDEKNMQAIDESK